MLVVDEDPDLLDLLAWRLGRAGFDVSGELDGRRGLATAIAVRPDIVVVADSAPIVGGLELCRRLRRDPASAQAKVLLVTSVVDDVGDLGSTGPDALVAKPFSISSLVARVRALAEVARPAGP